MAFLDKLNEVAKKVGDKTNEVAKIVGDKAGDAIETGKLSAKISAEKFAVQDDLKKIGEYYYSRFAAGEEVAAEVLGYCNSAKAHYDAIEAAREEMKQLKEDDIILGGEKAAEETVVEVVSENEVEVVETDDKIVE